MLSLALLLWPCGAAWEQAVQGLAWAAGSPKESGVASTVWTCVNQLCRTHCLKLWFLVHNCQSNCMIDSLEILRNSKRALSSSCNLQVTLIALGNLIFLKELLRWQGRKQDVFSLVHQQLCWLAGCVWQSILCPAFSFFSLQTVLKQLSCHVEEVSWVQHMCLSNIFLTRCPKAC